MFHGFLEIIHGDIKPTNVLVFESHGAFVVKVADFGFSTKATGNGLVNLPSSVPWYAPEYHPRRFSFAAAQKCDFFSFGMLCLWFLFHESLLSRSESSRSSPEEHSIIGEIERWSSPLAKLPTEFRLLESLKLKKRLLAFSHELVESVTDLESQQASSLKLFFNSTLAVDPEQRADGFLDLLRMLSQDE